MFLSEIHPLDDGFMYRLLELECAYSSKIPVIKLSLQTHIHSLDKIIEIISLFFLI